MPGNIELVAEKRTHPTELQDALVPVHHRQFIPAHQFLAGFLIIQSIGTALSTGIRGVIEVMR